MKTAKKVVQPAFGCGQHHKLVEIHNMYAANYTQNSVHNYVQTELLTRIYALICAPNKGNHDLPVNVVFNVLGHVVVDDVLNLGEI